MIPLSHRTNAAENQSANFDLSDTLVEILNANIEVLTNRSIQNLVNQWSNNCEDQEYYKEAIYYLYRSVNDPNDEFTAFLNKAYEGVEDEGAKASCRTLITISEHSNGAIHPDDLLYKQCSQISDLAYNPKRMELVGKYLKDAANNYLKDNYSEMYELIKNERLLEKACFEIEAANDLDATVQQSDSEMNPPSNDPAPSISPSLRSILSADTRTNTRIKISQPQHP